MVKHEAADGARVREPVQVDSNSFFHQPNCRFFLLLVFILLDLIVVSVVMILMFRITKGTSQFLEVKANVLLT